MNNQTNTRTRGLGWWPPGLPTPPRKNLTTQISMSLIFEATDAGRLVATKELWEFVEAGPLLGRIDDRFLCPFFFVVIWWMSALVGDYKLIIIEGGLIELYDVVHLSANSARSIHYSSHQISFQAAETLTSSCRMNLQAPAGPPPPAVSQPCKSCKWWEMISV